jgi:L-malate glycosyltransferase
MRIHQFVHTVTYGDAITSEALSIRRLLSEMGIQGEIYCVNAHDLLKPETKRIHEFNDDAADTAVVLHYSIASPLNDLYRSMTHAKRALIYHNLTPEQWFYGYNRRVVDDLRRAREGLHAAVAATDLLLGDSTYNCEELGTFIEAQSAAHVLPLLIDFKKWSIPANPGISALLRSHGGKNILSVGRIAPNKCFEDVIRAFYFYHHKINKESKLWLVGSDTDTEIYSFELMELVRHLYLENAVTFAGGVADTELKAFYEGSDLYVSMSEHEGFCVPLIEAMHFGLPLIAFDAGAVRETVGNGGCVVQRKSFGEIAELMEMILSSSELRGTLREEGRKRVTAFSEDSFKHSLRQKLIEPLQSLSETKPGKLSAGRAQ